jgi:hypothetical protein
MIGLLMDKRPESRLLADIPVRMWGMDADGRPFFQSATASNLSSEGAQLTRVHHALREGEIIGVQYSERKARFKVMWVKEQGLPNRVEAGVKILPGQTVPWDVLTEENRAAAKPSRREAEKRRFTRHKVLFPLQISFPDTQRAHMHCNATDIGARGCYIETLVPLSIGTSFQVTFWIDSDKFQTGGVVRASDPGVGMGIEFTGLTEEIQARLQAYLEKIDEGFAKAANQGT